MFNMKEERHGMVVTVDVMFSIILLGMGMVLLTWVALLFNTQKCFAEVTSSTCSLASRYGGNQSYAYKVQAGRGTTISESANAQIRYLQAVNGNVLRAYITVSDYPDANNCVTVTTYTQIAPYKDSLLSYAMDNTPGHQEELKTSAKKIEYVMPSLMPKGSLLEKGHR